MASRVSGVAWLLDRAQRCLTGKASSDYSIVDANTAAALPSGWDSPEVAQRQDRAFQPLVAAMLAGRPRADLAALGALVQVADAIAGPIVEVGCGSGYHVEVLHHVLRRRVEYVGVDWSLAMVRLARARHPHGRFIRGDARSLPFASAAAELVVDGVALMHVVDYRAAIFEQCRVSRRWCLFHTVPLVRRRATTFLRKRAYGAPTSEVIFNEGELRALFARAGLVVRAERPSVEYDLRKVVGEPTHTRSLLCERVG